MKKEPYEYLDFGHSDPGPMLYEEINRYLTIFIPQPNTAEEKSEVKKINCQTPILDNIRKDITKIKLCKNTTNIKGEFYKITTKNSQSFLFKSFTCTAFEKLKIYEEYNIGYAINSVSTKSIKMLKICEKLISENEFIVETLSEYHGKKLSDVIKILLLENYSDLIYELFYIFEICEKLEIKLQFSGIGLDSFAYNKITKKLIFTGLDYNSTWKLNSESYGKMVYIMLAANKNINYNKISNNETPNYGKILKKIEKTEFKKYIKILKICFSQDKYLQVEMREIKQLFDKFEFNLEFKNAYKNYENIDIKLRNRKLEKNDTKSKEIYWIFKILETENNQENDEKFILKKADLYYEMGIFNKSCENYEKILAKKITGDLNENHEILLKYAFCLIESQEYTKSEKIFTQVLQEILNNKYPNQENNLFYVYMGIMIIQAEFLNRNYSENYKNALNLGIKDNKLLFTIYLQYGLIYTKISETKMQHYDIESIKEKKIDSNKEEFSFLAAKFNYFLSYYSEKFEEKIKLLNEAGRILITYSNSMHPFLCQIYYRISSIYLKKIIIKNSKFTEHCEIIEKYINCALNLYTCPMNLQILLKCQYVKLLIIKGNIEKAKNSINEIKNLFGIYNGKKSGKILQEIKILYKLAKIFLELGHYKDSEKIAKKFIEISDKIPKKYSHKFNKLQEKIENITKNDANIILESLKLLKKSANLTFEKKDYQNAILSYEFINKNIDKYPKIYENLECEIYLNLALCYYEIGDLKLCRQICEKGIKYDKTALKLWVVLAQIYNIRRKFDKALLCFNFIENDNKIKENTELWLDYKINKANTYVGLHKLMQASLIIDDIWETYKENKEKINFNMNKIKLVKAKCLIEDEKYDIALNILKEIIKESINKENKFSMYSAEIYKILAVIYYKLDELQKSENAFKISESIYRIISNFKTSSKLFTEIYFYLSEINKDSKKIIGSRKYSVPSDKNVLI